MARQIESDESSPIVRTEKPWINTFDAMLFSVVARDVRGVSVTPILWKKEIVALRVELTHEGEDMIAKVCAHPFTQAAELLHEAEESERIANDEALRLGFIAPERKAFELYTNNAVLEHRGRVAANRKQAISLLGLKDESFLPLPTAKSFEQLIGLAVSSVLISRVAVD